jgi:CBS domain-containing protein
MNENGSPVPGPAASTTPTTPERTWFLSELLGSKARWQGRKVGYLADCVIADKGKVAEVTHACIDRPFGDPALLIPWERVHTGEGGELMLEIEAIEPYVGKPPEGAVLLKDYIVDKKVLDTEDREVAMVYDVQLVERHGKLFVTAVDLSRYGLLRRIGLKRLADFISGLASKIRDQTLAWTYVQPLPDQISSFAGDVKLSVLKDKLAEIPAVDLADILEEMDPAQRTAIFEKLDAEHASDTLEEIDPRIQRDLVISLKSDKAARLIGEMTPGQAADILSVLHWREAKAILRLLKNREEAGKIESILDKQEERILDYVISDYLRFPPSLTAGQARDQFQAAAKGKDVIMYLYVVDDANTLLGVIDLKELLKAGDEETLGDLMTTHIIHLDANSTLREASQMFARYGFRALPIMDEQNHVLGVVTYRDVMNLKHLFL